MKSMKDKQIKWPIKYIPEVLFFQEGPGVRKWQFKNKGVKLLNGSNINNGKLDLTTTDLYISNEEAYGKYKHFLIDEGDLLIASSGIVVDNFHNKIAFVKKENLPLCMNTSTIRFKSLNSKELSIDYFKYYLKTNIFSSQLRRLITGSAQLNFGPSHLNKIKIPIPPLEDQIRIASLLSRIEELIAKRKESIQLLDEFVKSTFLEMFGDPVRNEKGWEVDILENIVAESRIVTYGIVQAGPHVDNGIPYIKSGDIVEDKINIQALSRTSPEIAKKYKRSEVNYGDIIMSIRATVGTLALLPNELDGANLTQGTARITPGRNTNRQFLFNYLKTDQIQNWLQKQIKGATFREITLARLRTLPVFLPPIQIQNKFANVVLKVDSMKLKFDESLSELEKLYGAVSQRAFRGEM